MRRGAPSGGGGLRHGGATRPRSQLLNLGGTRALWSAHQKESEKGGGGDLRGDGLPVPDG